MSQSILTFSQMEKVCLELRPRLLGAELIRSVDLGEGKIVFFLEKDQFTEKLLISLQRPFLRFHLIQRLESSSKGSSHPLGALLDHMVLDSLELLNHDRILRLGFHQNEKKLFLIIEFFPKHPNYYLINEDNKILQTFYSRNQTDYQLPARHPYKDDSDSSIPLTHPAIENFYAELQKEFAFQQKKNERLVLLNKQLKRIQKSKEQLQHDLMICSTWKQIQHEGELLKNHFALIRRGLPFITVWDWLDEKERTLTLDPKLLPQEEIALRFKRSKKLQAGIAHLTNQIQKIEKQILSLQLSLKKLETVETLDELEAFTQTQLPKQARLQSQTKKKEKTAPLPYQEYESEAGLKIWVGKSAKDNERLTFSLARGTDWWLHAEGFPGSHVVIRTHKGEEPDPETLLDALQLALYYSKAKNRGEAEICLTQRKFVSRLGKGSQAKVGKVQISKHKTLFVRMDPKRYELLKERRSV